MRPFHTGLLESKNETKQNKIKKNCHIKIIPNLRQFSKLNQRRYLQIWREGVWESHVPRESTKDKIPHLNTVGRNDVTETEVVITQELWEVMKQDQQHAQCTLKIKIQRTSTICYLKQTVPEINQHYKKLILSPTSKEYCFHKHCICLAKILR